MGWKTWPYWLKGGIICLIIVILLTIIGVGIFYLLGLVFQISGIIPLFSFIIAISPGLFIGITLLGMSFKSFSGIDAIITIIISIIIYFIFGTFIGWIVGKVKSRRQINNTQSQKTL